MKERHERTGTEREAQVGRVCKPNGTRKARAPGECAPLQGGCQRQAGPPEAKPSGKRTGQAGAHGQLGVGAGRPGSPMAGSLTNAGSTPTFPTPTSPTPTSPIPAYLKHTPREAGMKSCLAAPCRTARSPQHGEEEGGDAAANAERARSPNKGKRSPDAMRPSSKFSDSRKKRVLPRAVLPMAVTDEGGAGGAGVVEQGGDEQTDLIQRDLMERHVEHMLGAAGASSSSSCVAAERRMKDSRGGQAATRRRLRPSSSGVDSIVFGYDLDHDLDHGLNLDRSRADDAAESQLYSGSGMRSSDQTNPMVHDMSIRSTNHMTAEQVER